MKRFFVLLLLAAILLTLLPFSAFASGTSGMVGSIYWSYNSKTHTVAFSGNGEIPDYAYGEAPWHQTSCYPIEHVVLGEGITRIGSNAFSMKDLQSIHFCKTLQSIGDCAFENASFSMEELVLPQNLNRIEAAAFRNAEVNKIKLPASLKTIDSLAFSQCRVQEINLENVETIGEKAFFHA